MNDKPNSTYDKFNWWIRNNKIAATLIVIGTIIIALSTFSDATRNLLGLFNQDKRPDINGVWSAEVNYDWANATYDETFVFEGEEGELHGTATFLKRKNMIGEGSVKNDRVEFITKTNEISSSWDEGESRTSIHRYSGKIQGDSIRFVMQTEGGYSFHTPIEFTAYKDSETTQ